MIEIRCSIKDADFLHITDGEKRYCGGDQAWFDHRPGKVGGCASVAAADISAYLALNHRGFEGLYTEPDFTRESYLRHMEGIYRDITPLFLRWLPNRELVFGVWPASRMCRGMISHGRKLGISLDFRQISGMRAEEQQIVFVTKALENDIPVAFLIGRNTGLKNISVTRPDGFSWVQKDFSSHWMVITAIGQAEGKTYLKVSTWGGFSWISLSECLSYRGWPQALLYFQ